MLPVFAQVLQHRHTHTNAHKWGKELEQKNKVALAITQFIHQIAEWPHRSKTIFCETHKKLQAWCERIHFITSQQERWQRIKVRRSVASLTSLSSPCYVNLGPYYDMKLLFTADVLIYLK